MKKILILFFLFTISLFGQFKETPEVDGRRAVEMVISSQDNYEFIIYLMKHNNSIEFSVGAFGLAFENKGESMEIDDLFIDTPSFTKNGCWFEITKVKDMKYILQKIVKGKKIHFRADNRSYIIDFSRYKNDLIKSKMYNYIMTL